MMRCGLQICGALLAALISGGCREVNDERIPYRPVYIEFTNQGDWQTYGVPGPNGQISQRFILGERQPAGFPYNTSSATGYGGVLLFYGMDPFNNEMGPLAYDLSCPVEKLPDVRVWVDEVNLEAVCDVCGSHYNVFNRGGVGISGPALDFGYGLRRYECVDAPNGGHLIRNLL